MTHTSASSSLKKLSNADFVRLEAYIPFNELRKKTILITGATGFFGAWLLSLFDWLNRVKGIDVSVVALSRTPLAFIDRHPHFASVSWLKWITGDVKDFTPPPQPIDYVIHAATDTSAAAGKNPSLLFKTIIDGTEHVLDVANRKNASRILLVSSGAIYGSQANNVTHVQETAISAPSPLLTANAYGEGKRVMELLGIIHAEETNATVTIARCFAFVGAGLPLDGHFAIGNFIRDALEKDQIAIRSGGTAERSYLYVADLVIWLIRLLIFGQNKQAYNVGSDQVLTIAELARCVVQTLAPTKQVAVLGKDDPHGGRNRYIPSIELARTQCGVDVWTDITQAISLTAAYRP